MGLLEGCDEGRVVGCADGCKLGCLLVELVGWLDGLKMVQSSVVLLGPQWAARMAPRLTAQWDRWWAEQRVMHSAGRLVERSAIQSVGPWERSSVAWSVLLMAEQWASRGVPGWLPSWGYSWLPRRYRCWL